jgi:putative sterol carrier protein
MLRWAEIEEEKAMPAPKVSSIKEYFDTLDQRFLPAGAKGVDATFQFELGGDGGGTFHVVVKDGGFSWHEGTATAPTSTIKMEAGNYIKMVNGELNGTMAFMKGQLKVSGNMMLAQKMQAIFPPNKA